MNLQLQPVRVAAGADEEGRLVFTDDGRLVAVLTRLSEQHGSLCGHWFLEAGFGSLDGPSRPIFPDTEAARDWISRRLAG